MHLLGTIFSGRLLHIWCSREYSGHFGLSQSSMSPGDNGVLWEKRISFTRLWIHTVVSCAFIVGLTLYIGFADLYLKTKVKNCSTTFNAPCFHIHI